jgi:NADH-quinone oxidoreductase subunit N
MGLVEAIGELFRDGVQASPARFACELILIATLAALLIDRLLFRGSGVGARRLAAVGTAIALGVGAWQLAGWLVDHESSPTRSVPLFSGLLVFDGLTAFIRVYLLLFTLLMISLTSLSGIPDRDDAPDFYVLLLGSMLGLMVLAAANHWMIVFLGVEMASVPSYVLVGFLKGRRISSEAALKYMVYGAGASGVMLYGISLLLGLLGTGSLSEMGPSLLGALGGDGSLATPITRTLILALALVFCGIGYKLSAVPFQFWCPDAFQGASAEVALALSIASKAGATAALIRIGLAMIDVLRIAPSAQEVGTTLGVGLAVLAAITTTFGNLSAFPQTNMKRLLAYSTIAQAGYLLMGVAALFVIGLAPTASPAEAARQATGSAEAIEAVLFYLCVYCFMNLGAFSVVVAVRNQLFSEELPQWAGVARTAPGLAICLALCLFSLTGLPPLGGFVAKLKVLGSLYNAGQYHPVLWGVMVVGALNTVISLVYYLRVLQTIFFHPAPADAVSVRQPLGLGLGRFVALVTVPVVLLGLIVDPLAGLLHDIARSLIR